MTFCFAGAIAMKVDVKKEDLGVTFRGVFYSRLYVLIKLENKGENGTLEKHLC
jgi:hypothetical protein